MKDIMHFLNLCYDDGNIEDDKRSLEMKNRLNKFALFYVLVITTALFTFSGCARVGHDFNARHVNELKIGQTTKSDVINMFGEPWRIGNENGVSIWTYGKYTYYLVGEADTKDLVIKFNDNGTVRSYTFNKTLNEE